MTTVASTTTRVEPVRTIVTSPVAYVPATVRRAIRPQMVALAIVALFVVATLALPHRPSPVAAAAAGAESDRLEQSSDIPLVAQSNAPASSSAVARATVAPVVASPVVTELSRKPAVPKPEKNAIGESSVPPASVTPGAEALANEDLTTKRDASESGSAEPPRVSPNSVEPGTVTITGCLEANQNRFLLTDTEGADVPKSRSWRTGFLKKHSTSVALVEPHDPHDLHTQVGERVAATGVLTNRDLRVTSVRPIGARCD